MQLLPNDIIIRNYKDGETIWISQRLVMQICGVTDEYLRRSARFLFKKSIEKKYKYGDFLPNTGKSWRWGKANGTFYYDFDFLPDRKPTYYRTKFGTKHELLQRYEALQSERQQSSKERLACLIKQQVETMVDNTSIIYYMYKNPIVGFNQIQATEMATAHAWCIWLNKQIEDEKFKQLGIHKISDLYQICTEIISPLNLEGLRIKSADYLRKKVDNFPIKDNVIEQLNYFINGRYGNDNAKIVGKYPLVNESTGQIHNFDIHQALMFQLYMNPGSSTKEYIHSLYQYYIEDIKEFEIQPIAYRTFCNHLNRFNRQIQTALARHGYEHYRKNVETYVTTEKLKYAHSLFAGDGSGTINYRYKKNSKWATMKLYVILITDVASRYIVGWSVAPEGSHKENEVMTKTAVKMAIENSGKQTLFEFISDNHGAFTSSAAKEFLNLAFNKVRTIEVGNSQANPAETQFRLFKRSLKDIKNFVSTSWDAGLENKANPDHLDLNELPTYEDAVIQFHELVKRWNNTALRDGISPAERFENKNPNCEPMEPIVLRYLFGKHTEVDISYMRGYVDVYRTKGYSESEKFQFEIPEYGGAGTDLIAKHTGYTPGALVKVVWDEDFADLYSLDGKYILTCPGALKASQAAIETTDTHAYAIAHHLDRKKQQEEFINEFEASLSEVINDLGYEHAMAFGSSKEQYNGSLVEKEHDKLVTNSIKERVDRDFKPFK